MNLKAFWERLRSTYGHLGVDFGHWVWKYTLEGVEELANKTISFNQLHGRLLARPFKLCFALLIGRRR